MSNSTFDLDLPGRILSTSEDECHRVDILDSSFPGVMTSTVSLMRSAIEQSKQIVPESDSRFAAELLLLAGMSLILANDEQRFQHSCVHFEKLKMDGKLLPPQSVFVCLQEAGKQTAKQPKMSPIRSYAQDTREDGNHPESIDEFTPAKAAVNSKFDSVPLDTDDEFQRAVEEFERDQARFSDKPTMKTSGVKLPKKRVDATIQVPRRAAGADGLSFRRDM